jgi:pSer/pThr/pTyr-binding forkhead associated (FHA) protein
MAKLILMFNKQVIKEYPFSKDSLTLGRKPDNDIPIDNPAVSGYHSRIDKTGSAFILTDLQSTNGTFVNDHKIVTHKLVHGDHITIGKHTLVFLEADGEQFEASHAPGQMDLDKTMVLDTAKQRELLSRQEPPAEQKPEKIGVLSFIDSSKMGEVQLTKKLTRIGKSPNSEVKLGGLFMGPTAATIAKRPSGYFITFAGGMAKLKVNGETIKETAPLKDFDTIEIGSYKFQFYQKETK